MFDICSTIKFHGKIKFVKISQFVAAFAAPPTPPPPTHQTAPACTVQFLMKMYRWMKAFTVGDFHSLPWQGSAGAGGSVGGGIGDVGSTAVPSVSSSVLSSSPASAGKGMISSQVQPQKNSSSLAAAASRRGINLVQLLHLRPKKLTA